MEESRIVSPSWIYLGRTEDVADSKRKSSNVAQSPSNSEHHMSTTFATLTGATPPETVYTSKLTCRLPEYWQSSKREL